MAKKGEYRCNNSIGFKTGNRLGYCNNYPAVKQEGKQFYCQECLDKINNVPPKPISELFQKANNLLMTKKPITDKTTLIKKLKAEAKRMRQAEIDERSRWNDVMGDMYARNVVSCNEMIKTLEASE